MKSIELNDFNERVAEPKSMGKGDFLALTDLSLAPLEKNFCWLKATEGT